MTPRSLTLLLLPLAACGGGSAPPPPAPSAAPTTAAVASSVPAVPTLTIQADVVTIDTAAPSVTLREGDVPPLKSPKASDIKKGDRTIKLESATVSFLAGIKPGDRVTVTCRQIVLTTAPSGPASAAPAVTSAALDQCEAVTAIAKAETSTSAAASSPAP